MAGCTAPTQPTPTPTATADQQPAAWTSITWRRLDPADPIASFVGVVPTPDGLFAWGERRGTLLGSYSPLWTSTDGKSWQELGAATLGATGVVLNVHPFRGQLVALTMSGDESVCPETDLPSCWLIRAPLRAWTSADGLEWTFRAEPMNVVDDPARRDPFAPLSAATSRSIVVTHQSRGEVSLAISNDGATWQALAPQPALAGGGLSGLATVADRLVGIRAGVVWSDGGFVWRTASAVPFAEPEPRLLAAARRGVIVAVSAPDTIGQQWWLSADGDRWTAVDEFEPLGRRREVTGDWPNGELIGDGLRMVAHQFGGARAWSSLDGVEWTQLSVDGDLPPPPPVADAMTVLPIGLIYRDDRGAWFGEPH